MPRLMWASIHDPRQLCPICILCHHRLDCETVLAWPRLAPCWCVHKIFQTLPYIIGNSACGTQNKLVYTPSMKKGSQESSWLIMRIKALKRNKQEEENTHSQWFPFFTTSNLAFREGVYSGWHLACAVLLQLCCQWLSNSARKYLQELLLARWFCIYEVLCNICCSITLQEEGCPLAECPL